MVAMHRIRIFFLLLLVGLSFLGCSPPTRTITGQVFIATQGGQSVKLGGVTVSLFREDSLKTHVAARTRAHAQLVASIVATADSVNTAITGINATNAKLVADRKAALRAQIVAIDEEVAIADTKHEKASQVWSDAARRYGAAVSRAMNNVHVSSREPAPEEARVRDIAAEERDAAYGEAAQARYRRDALVDQLEHTSIGAASKLNLPPLDVTAFWYFTGLDSGASATAQTDADGRFSLDVPSSGKFFLVARSERKVIDSTERYGWMVRVPPASEKPTPIFLNHSNLLPDGVPLDSLIAK
jgi:hypothetical protein